ncbi:MAG: hypothetical protein IIC94_01915 [Chloroflexi bacterium]|nr:hypothetical protein [Chloroflexota bacterium]
MTQAPRSRWWRWRPSFRRDRDLITVAIERGADSGGCAVCSVLEARERRSLWILLREHVLDPGTRGDWNRTLGFCARHTSALCATATGMGQLPGVAILFGDTTREVARRIGTGAPLHVWRDCLECGREVQSEAAHLRRLAQQLGDAGWTAQWAPKLRLCVRHAASIMGTGMRTGMRTGVRARPTVPLADHLRELAVIGGGHDARSLRRTLATLQAALLGFESPSGIPALPLWGCGQCDAETTAVTDEGRRLFQEGATPEGTLCRRHASLLLDRSAVTPAQLAAHYSAALQAAAGALEERRTKRSAGLPISCPLCDFVEARAPELAASVALDSEAALCLRHVEVALEAPASAGAFGAAHIEALRALSHELGELHRKSAWDAREEPKGTEQTSWIRAAHYLSYDAGALPLARRE